MSNVAPPTWVLDQAIGYSLLGRWVPKLKSPLDLVRRVRRDMCEHFEPVNAPCDVQEPPFPISSLGLFSSGTDRLTPFHPFTSLYTSISTLIINLLAPTPSTTHLTSLCIPPSTSTSLVHESYRDVQGKNINDKPPKSRGVYRDIYISIIRTGLCTLPNVLSHHCRPISTLSAFHTPSRWWANVHGFAPAFSDRHTTVDSSRNITQFSPPLMP